MQALLYSVPPALQQATANPHLHQRLLDIHGEVWVSLLWGHCSFLLGPGVHKVVFVCSMTLSPQSCVSSGGSMVGLMVTSSKRAYAIPTSAAPRAPASAAGTLQETLKPQFWLSLCGVYGSWCSEGLFEPSEGLCWVWGLIPNVIS